MAEKKVNYQELQKHVTSLNENCGTSIKVIGAKKGDLIDDFKGAIAAIDNPPKEALDYYNRTFGPQAEESEGAEAAEQPVTALGNTMETMLPIANTLEIEGAEEMNVEALQKKIFDVLDDMPEDDWKKLPENVQQWDHDMADAIEKKQAQAKKEAAKKKKEPIQESKPKVKSDDPAEKKPKKAKDHGPRPDFKFSPGTNAAQIIDVFNTLFTASNGEGIKMKNLQEACENANIKTKNVKGRVRTVIRYASTEPGGSQVVKVGKLLYPKGSEPKL